MVTSARKDRLPLSAKKASLEDIFASTDGAYVYFLMVGNVCVYVGRTKSLSARIGAHVRRKEFSSVYFITATQETVCDLEKEWIRKLSPKLNKIRYPQKRKTGTRGRPPKPPEDLHSAVVYLKLTPAQRELLERGAAAAGQPLTVWAREVLVRAAKRLA